MKKLLTLSVFAFTAFFSMVAFAGTVTVPNIFVSGGIATAASVNDNFTALRTGINSNNITLYKNDGTAVGAILTFEEGSGMYYKVVTENYYTATIRADGNIVGNVVYASNDCTGIPYINGTQNVVRIIHPVDGEKYYYSPKGGNHLTFEPQSYVTAYSDPQCMPGSPFGTVGIFFESIANSPGTTGIDNSPIGTGYYIGGR